MGRHELLLCMELRSVECPGIGNYKKYRIFGGIPHTSNVVTLQTLELLESWKLWRWEISEVSLYCIPPKFGRFARVLALCNSSLLQKSFDNASVASASPLFFPKSNNYESTSQHRDFTWLWALYSKHVDRRPLPLLASLLRTTSPGAAYQDP